MKAQLNDLGIISAGNIAAASTVGALGVAGRCVYRRVTQGQQGVISALGIHPSVVSGNICLAVYRPGPAVNQISPLGLGRASLPVKRVATTGSVACPTGWTAVALDAPIEVFPGDWFAIATDSATTAFYGETALLINSNLAAGIECYQDASAFPCPDVPAVFSNGYVRSPIIVGVP